MDQDQIVEAVQQKLAEEAAKKVAMATLGVAVPVVGLAMLGYGALSHLFSGDDDAEEALKAWVETQSSPVSEVEAHGFINGYRWAKK